MKQQIISAIKRTKNECLSPNLKRKLVATDIDIIRESFNRLTREVQGTRPPSVSDERREIIEVWCKLNLSLGNKDEWGQELAKFGRYLTNN